MENVKKRIVMASSNTHKIEEAMEILKEYDFDIVPMSALGIVDDIVEDGATFEENSYIKANYIVTKYGYSAIADDSGLEVDALQGAPGVYSARFAGEPKSDENNNRLLLQKMKNVPKENRGARFVSVITLILVEGSHKKVFTARGTIEGSILEEPRGNGGFGYDPLFYISEKHKSMAELSADEKNTISHRYEALMNLKNQL